MNQRPFISTNLNIFDENRCVFSPSTIGGQPVMISQEQNRKICDTMTTAIASNQPRGGNCYCACQHVPYPTQAPTYSCALQAQKQGVPGGVVFNFSQPSYCCPPTCVPSAYNPPSPPAPQIIECPYKTPQSVCVDFGKYGMEAMAFQQKCRKQCIGFTYDKQVGTNDQIVFPKCNTCCCGVQAVTLTADQKKEIFHRVDETDNKQTLDVNSCDTHSLDRKRCICFPKPNPNKYGNAKTLVIGERKENACKDYDIVDQATREADAEAYLCCDCLDKWKKENACKKPSCLKIKGETSEMSINEEKRRVSFSFHDNSLVISENQKAQEDNETTPSSQDNGTEQDETTTIGSRAIPASAFEGRYTAEEVEDIKEMNKLQSASLRKLIMLRKKERMLKTMSTFFSSSVTITMRNLLKDIENTEAVYKTAREVEAADMRNNPSENTENANELNKNMSNTSIKEEHQRSVPSTSKSGRRSDKVGDVAVTDSQQHISKASKTPEDFGYSPPSSAEDLEVDKHNTPDSEHTDKPMKREDKLEEENIKELKTDSPSQTSLSKVPKGEEEEDNEDDDEEDDEDDEDEEGEDEEGDEKQDESDENVDSNKPQKK